MSLAAILSKVESAGAVLRLDGDNVRIWYPDERRRRFLSEQVAALRDRRSEVAGLLRARKVVHQMPAGVRVIQWSLKEPPVAIETCAVVSDTALFANTTLEQLRLAIAEPKRWVGWNVPQLIDRLAQVGVRVALEQQTRVAKF